MSLEDMGKMNSGMGICGFTSCLYALYNINPGPNTQHSHYSTLANSETEFIKTIAEYLEDLQQRNRPLAEKIETFTQTFGWPFTTFTITNYIDRVSALDTNPITGETGFNSFSVAMTPEGIIDFLSEKCGLPNAHSLPVRSGIRPFRSLRTPPRECIIGLKGQGSKAPYKGLAHWIYKRDQTIYSWGKIFAYKNYKHNDNFTGLGSPCYYISLR